MNNGTPLRDVLIKDTASNVALKCLGLFRLYLLSSLALLLETSRSSQDCQKSPTPAASQVIIPFLCFNGMKQAQNGIMWLRVQMDAVCEKMNS